MMRSGLYGILFGMAVLLTVSLTGCGQREIVCPGEEARPLEILFSWEKAPGACPEGMTLYFYDADNNGWCRRFDISGSEGGRFELPAGRYNMIAVNNDLPGVRIDGYQGFHSASAVAQPGGAESGQDLPAVRPTGMLYGAVMTDIEVTLCGVRYRAPDGSLVECPKGLVRCAPDSLANEYHVIFENVNGADRILSAKGVLSGMASKLILCEDSAGPDECCVSFPMEVAAVKESGAVMRGATTGFGMAAGFGLHQKYSLTAVIKLKNGNVYSKTYDVSDQVENYLHSNTIIIIINGIDIPSGDVPGDTGGGFEVGVGGWEIVEIEL